MGQTENVMRFFYVLGMLVVLSCSAAQTPDDLFAAARQKLQEAAKVEVQQVLIVEIPDLDDFDTIIYVLDFRKNPEAIFGYDFYGERDGFESAYIQGVQYEVHHLDSTVQTTEVVDSTSVQYSMLRTFNPIVLFENDPWTYVRDTTIEGKKLLGFKWIEMDTVIDEKKVYLENHLFINPANLLPEFYSRRLYHDGKRNQLIESAFEDWQLADTAQPLVFDFPKGYLTKVEGSTESPLLKVGAQAPEFELTDADGNAVILSDFRGKKVLLDFSIINCGWCKIALEKFAKPDYEFAENIVPLYINPVDSEEKMEKYLSKVKIPFTVLLDAKDVGKSYGVNGFPTFYLIDETGKIEEVTQGYSDEGILNWKKKSE